jgi:DNA-binding beta-propeller fold protein YncE
LPNGVISTVASVGSGGVAVDSAGNLYISWSGQHVIHMVRPNGTDSIIAGTGMPGYSGDGGQATAAQLFSPAGLRVDPVGNLYVADSGNNRVRKITPQGVISTVAGNGQPGFSGDGAAAAGARMCIPTEVALGVSGVLYIADSQNFRIRAVSANGMISTFAGGVSGGVRGASLLDGPERRRCRISDVGFRVTP